MNDVMYTIAEVVKEASALQRKGMDIHAALVKAASDRGLNMEQTRRAVESLNTLNTLEQFRAGEKTAEFPVADGRDVVRRLFQKEAAAISPPCRTPLEYSVEVSTQPPLAFQDQLMLKRAHVALDSDAQRANREMVQYTRDPHALVQIIEGGIRNLEKQAGTLETQAAGFKDKFLGTMQKLAESFQYQGSMSFFEFAKEASSAYGEKVRDHLTVLLKMVPRKFHGDQRELQKRASYFDDRVTQHQLIKLAFEAESQFAKVSQRARPIRDEADGLKEALRGAFFKQGAPKKKGGGPPSGASLATLTDPSEMSAIDKTLRGGIGEGVGRLLNPTLPNKERLTAMGDIAKYQQIITDLGKGRDPRARQQAAEVEGMGKWRHHQDVQKFKKEVGRAPILTRQEQEKWERDQERQPTLTRQEQEKWERDQERQPTLTRQEQEDWVAKQKDREVAIKQAPHLAELANAALAKRMKTELGVGRTTSEQKDLDTRAKLEKDQLTLQRRDVAEKMYRTGAVGKSMAGLKTVGTGLASMYTGLTGKALEGMSMIGPLLKKDKNYGYYDQLADSLRMQSSIQQVLDEDPILRERDPKELMPIIQTLTQVAPEIVSQPATLASLLRQATSGQFETLDPLTLSQLAEAQTKLWKNREIYKRQIRGDELGMRI